ncbi:hypothetical protein AB0I10_28750 [Streptomyces sp. NPDC050636]|uniref:hypothetical protein n=1 Tax=Streptomyces sp. NPDC050636 TaxID=3154510 RepID=UPI00342FF0D4
MATNRRPSLVRATAVAAVAGAALLLPAAASAFAAGPGSAIAAPAAVIASKSQAKTVDIGGGLEAVIKGGVCTIRSIGDGKVLATLKKGETYNKGVYVHFDGRNVTAKTQGGAKAKHHKAGRKHVRTQALKGGFTAKIYQLGKRHYQAELIAKDPATGKPVTYDTLETKNGKPACGQHNGAHFVLKPDGSMTSWTAAAKKK